MKLLQIILEQSNKPKAIIMAGGGGAGKSFILDKLGLSGLKIYNPDKYVEKQGLPLAAASSMVDKEVQKAVQDKESFIWDTTGGNPSKVQEIVEAGYDVAMVMVYTHPIISFIANFDRQERSLPISAVLSTWRNTYSLIDTYQSMLGDQFYLIPNLRGDKYQKEIEQFSKAARAGSEGIENFLDNLKQQDPDKYKSTFSKPFELTDQEEIEAYQDSIKDLKFDRDDKAMVKGLQKHFDGFWKKGKLPPSGSMEKKVAAIERERVSGREASKQVASDISDMINSKEFKNTVSSGDSIEQVRSNLQSFLSR